MHLNNKTGGPMYEPHDKIWHFKKEHQPDNVV